MNASFTDVTFTSSVHYDNSERFLLVRLHMDSLVEKLNARQVCAALEILPGGMDGTYDKAMERVERQDDSSKQFTSPGSHTLFDHYL
jgi:hypothetical protein